MSHRGQVDLPPMPLPNPWLMGLVAIGAGATLCWLAVSSGRDERSLWQGRRSGLRTYYETSWMLGGAFIIVLGIVILIATIVPG